MTSERKTTVITERQDKNYKELERQQEKELIRAALIVGEQSGEAKSLDFQ